MKDRKLIELANEWLVEATIEDLQRAMSTREISSKQLVMMYLHRIAQFDKQGPNINSVLEVNPQAIQIAEALDLERADTGPRSDLHGIPVLLKDNIDTGDDLHTSAGSLALRNHRAMKDSFVAKKLREAGAVILGKTNLTEWANFMTDNMPNGYSSRGGQVKNPYGPGSFDVGGSSSGSGAAVAANLCALAIGTETSGSILSPASSNSVVGIKPTVGLISRTGIIPISHTQDTAGPIARTVLDAAILLQLIVGKDETDPVTLTNPNANIDYVKELKGSSIEGLRIGVPNDAYYEYLNEDEKDLMNAVLDTLRSLGATVIEDVKMPPVELPWDFNVLLYEFKTGLNAYLRHTNSYESVKNLADVIAFNEQHANDTLKYGQTLLIQAEETTGTLTEPTYINSLLNDQYICKEAGIDAVLEQNNLDILLFANNYGAGIPAKAGYPSITVPAGYTNEGKPLGATFTSAAFKEMVLLKVAYAFEKATKYRKAPTF
ncbi:amidase [Bacillus sp. HMF5848]|uniref:amidase family protein n=1 Tax=Bacillus sp. HMF5848 TaxID=2495421 RepID=UPI000F7B5151|nr:amidase family protein [Bacillus sp. HMF5848]RSK27374.1 amidase [Bacillus sp. HMF5848]